MYWLENYRHTHQQIFQPRESSQQRNGRFSLGVAMSVCMSLCLRIHVIGCTFFSKFFFHCGFIAGDLTWIDLTRPNLTRANKLHMKKLSGIYRIFSMKNILHQWFNTKERQPHLLVSLSTSCAVYWVLMPSTNSLRTWQSTILKLWAVPSPVLSTLNIYPA